MQELIAEMHRAMANEYKRMAEKYGAGFHSTHEAYAIVKEEVEEAMASIHAVLSRLCDIWERTKVDEPTAEGYESARSAALEAAAECIQVAACCDKALRSEGVVRE